MTVTLLSPNRMFVPLDPGELNRIRGDEDLQEIYMDSLGLVQDLLCRFVEEHGRPQFPDLAEVARALDEVTERGQRAVLNNPTDHSIVESMRENAARAKVLSTDVSGTSVYPVHQVKQEIARFLDSALEQFIQISRR